MPTGAGAPAESGEDLTGTCDFFLPSIVPAHRLGVEGDGSERCSVLFGILARDAEGAPFGHLPAASRHPGFKRTHTKKSLNRFKPFAFDRFDFGTEEVFVDERRTIN